MKLLWFEACVMVAETFKDTLRAMKIKKRREVIVGRAATEPLELVS